MQWLNTGPPTSRSPWLKIRHPAEAREFVPAHFAEADNLCD